jgi:hypothetical protein
MRNPWPDEYIRLSDLGMTAAEAEDLYPHAVLFVGHDDELCIWVADINPTAALGDEEGPDV